MSLLNGMEGFEVHEGLVINEEETLPIAGREFVGALMVVEGRGACDRRASRSFPSCKRAYVTA